MGRDPLILGFDTSAAHCAAAVICGDRVLSQRVEPMTKGQAERLMVLLEQVLADAGVTWSDLQGIGVGIGPGNFTGIRISVAAARGLALSLGVPAAGVTVTEAVACDAPRPCRAIVPARGDEVFWQDFDAHGPMGGPAQSRPDDLPPGPREVRAGRTDAPAPADQPVVPPPGPMVLAPFTPSAFAADPSCAASLVTGDAAPVHDTPPLAVGIARVAARAIAHAAGAPIPRPAPFYLRPADAAPPRDPAPTILP